MNKKFDDLEQYYFNRDDFIAAFTSVFNNFELDVLFSSCEQNMFIDDFHLCKSNDEYYIIHLCSGTIINWYKHLGRTNTCNKSDISIDDLIELLKMLKGDMFL